MNFKNEFKISEYIFGVEPTCEQNVLVSVMIVGRTSGGHTNLDPRKNHYIKFIRIYGAILNNKSLVFPNLSNKKHVPFYYFFSKKII